LSKEEVLVSLYAASKKIYPRSVEGIFAYWRWVFVAITQVIFYGLPWMEWGTRQAVLFDLASRRFYIFGLVLYPQDFIYLTGLLVVSALSLFLFTAVAGRLWCGYACPQTVYSEIFMWIERKVEGDRSARIRLEMVQTFPVDQPIDMDGFYFCGVLHAYTRFRYGVFSHHHGWLGIVLGFLLWLCNLWQCRLYARASLQIHVSLCALSKRYV
jgi:hypothetical protein